MKPARAYALISFGCVGLAACHFGGNNQAAAPSGQVVATVEGKEITLTQLNAELAGVNAPNPQARKAAEQGALRLIILRTALARAAHDQGLDKTPEFAIQKQRVDDNLLAQTLENKIAASAQTPTRQEVDRYMADHPELFSQRKIFVVDQIRMARPSDPKLLKELQPLNTLPDVETLLQREQVKFQRGTANLDAVGMNPKLVEQIVKLPPNEVFVLPDNGLVLVNQIRETQVVPFTGDPAVQYATALLKRQYTQEKVDGEFGVIMAKAAKTIHYNPGYQPPKPPAAPHSTPASNINASGNAT
jgi:EpsD family peptidyl-prolyl cis-trans isomerase